MIGQLCLYAGLAGVATITVHVALVPHHQPTRARAPQCPPARARVVRLVPIDHTVSGARAS